MWAYMGARESVRAARASRMGLRGGMSSCSCSCWGPEAVGRLRRSLARTFSPSSLLACMHRYVCARQANVGNVWVLPVHLDCLCAQGWCVCVCVCVPVVMTEHVLPHPPCPPACTGLVAGNSAVVYVYARMRGSLL